MDQRVALEMCAREALGKELLLVFVFKPDAPPAKVHGQMLCAPGTSQSEAAAERPKMKSKTLEFTNENRSSR